MSNKDDKNQIEIAKKSTEKINEIRANMLENNTPFTEKEIARLQRLKTIRKIALRETGLK